MSETITGAIIALVGVALTLISGHIFEWIKASRAKKESQRQRELDLKRELYLPLVQAFTEGVNLFIAIPQAHHTKLADLRLSQAAQNALAAKDLIANERVITAVSTVGKQLVLGLQKLMLVKLDEVQLAIDLECLSKRISELISENRLIVDRMQALQVAGTLQPIDVQALDSQFRSNLSERHKLFTEQEEKQNSHNKKMKEIHEQSMKEVAAMTAIISTAVIEIRRDLQLPTNEEAIRKYYKESIEYTNKELPGFIDEVWEKIEANKNG